MTLFETIDNAGVNAQAARRKISQKIQALRSILEWTYANPHIPGIMLGTSFCVSADVYQDGTWRPLTKEELAEVVRAMKRLGPVTKTAGEHYMTYEVRGPGDERLVELNVARDRVCTAKVVGTEEILVPDPDAPKITKTVDVIEWECDPLLQAAEEEA